MQKLLMIAAMAVMAGPGVAQDSPAEATPGTETASASPAVPGFAPLEAAAAELDDFLWTRRPLIVFANSPADPAFAEQMRLLEALWHEMAERDVVAITDTDPAAMSALRTKLRPRGFMLVLIGKDGAVVLRKPFPWDVRELSRAIDKLPMRREELRLKRMPAR